MPKQKNVQVKTKVMPPASQEMKQTPGWKPYLVLTILTFMLYSNTLNHFFALDDGIVMIENEFTQKGIKGIPDIFKYDTFVGWILFYNKEKTADQVQEGMKYVAGGRYRPLSLATFALEIQFFGKKNNYPEIGNFEFKGNAFVSHLNNILLYLFTTCLLYLILYRLAPPSSTSPPSGGLGGAAFIIAILFLAHPIHTEVVANIKGRDEIMTLLGSLAALWFTIKYVDTNKVYNLLLSGLCLFLGLLSKENAITFLAVIPITIYYFVDRKIGKIFKAMIPLIVAAAVFLLIRASILGINIEATSTSLLNNPFLDATKGETMATIFYTLLLYVKLLFFPHPLTWDYYPHHIEIVNWTNPVAILSLLFYLGITAYAIYGLFKLPLTPPKGENCDRPSGTSPLSGGLGGAVSYSIWFYLLPLTIVSNLFFPIGVFMGERFIFISSIGFCIFIGWLIYNYFPKITKNIKGSTYLTSFVMIIILCLYSVKTISRNNAWKNDFTLCETDIKTSGNSAKGNFQFGYFLLKKATYPSNEIESQKRDEFCEKAAQYLKHAIELYPMYPDVLEQLGYLYFNCYKDVAKSLHYHAVALQTTVTRSKDIYQSAIIVLNETAGLDENQISSTPNEILQSCDELLEVRPNCGEAYYVKGLIYGKYLNNMELSLINFEKALTLDFPKTAKFYVDLGVCYGMSANYEKALQYLLKAIELDTDAYAAYLNLGLTYEHLGDIKNANFYTQKGDEIERKQLIINN